MPGGRGVRTRAAGGARTGVGRGLAVRPIVRHGGGRRVRMPGGRGVRTRAAGGVRTRAAGGVRIHAVPLARTRADQGGSVTAIGRRVSGSRTLAHGETGARATAATGSDRRMGQDGVPLAGSTAKRGLRTLAIADRAGTSRPNLGPAVDGLARGGLVRPGLVRPGIAPPGIWPTDLVRPDMERRGMVGHRMPGGMATAVQADRGSARLTRLAGCLRFRQGSRPTSLARRPRPS